MTDSGSARCSGFFTYAAFAAADGQPAGWRVGQVDGISREDAQQLSGQIPSYLAGEAPVPRYAGEEELKQLVHRAVWRRSPADQETMLFIHSTPAGTDASGRPSNVFTSVYVFDEGAQLGCHPAALVTSPSLLRPFNKEVNHRRIESRELAVDPSVTPRLALEHLIAETRRSLDHVRSIAATVLDAIHTQAPRVALADDPKNAWAWLTLITSALDAETARSVQFSTYERAHTIDGEGTPKYGIWVVPRDDAVKVAEAFSNVDVINVLAGVSRGSAQEGRPSVVVETGQEIPVTELSELFVSEVTSPSAAAALATSPRISERVAQQPIMATETPLVSPVVERSKNPFNKPAEGGTGVEKRPFEQSPPPRVRTQAAEIREVSPQYIADLHGLMDRHRSWSMWTGDARHRGWPGLIEILLATADQQAELRRLQIRAYAYAAVALAQVPDKWIEVDWLPWWRLEDDRELRNSVRELAQREIREVPIRNIGSTMAILLRNPLQPALRGLLESLGTTPRQPDYPRPTIR